MQRFKQWKLSTAAQAIVNARSKALAAGMPKEYPHGMQIMSRYAQYKCVTWSHLTASQGWAYLFEGLFPSKLLKPLLKSTSQIMPKLSPNCAHMYAQIVPKLRLNCVQIVSK